MRFLIVLISLVFFISTWANGQEAAYDSVSVIPVYTPNGFKVQDDFNQGNLYDPWQLLIGKVPGLAISRPGGDPNLDYEIRIRGVNTWTSNSVPLIVLDGVVGATLNQVDPNNIASVEVLKTSAATAFYGVRGSNGVVIINTRMANAEALEVTAGVSISIDQLGRTMPVLGPEEFLARGGTNFGAQTDWIEESTQTGLTENANFSIRQNLGKTSFRISANYRDIEGIVSPVTRKRINATVAIRHEITDRLEMGFSFFATQEERGKVNPLAFRQMTIYNPTAPVFDDLNTAQDGGYFQRDLFDFFNPISLLREQIDEEEEKSTLLNFSFNYRITPDLTLSGNYAQDRFNILGGRYNSRYDLMIGMRSNGIASRSTLDSFSEIGDLKLDYTRELGSSWILSAQLGLGFQNREEEGFWAQVRQFLLDSQGFDNLRFGSIRSGFNTDVSSFLLGDRLNSTYARATVASEKGFKAFLNLRADSYSGFINNKTGLFYGLGLEYDLLKVVDAGPITRLTVRASTGRSGNLPPDPTIAYAVFGPGGAVDLDNDPNTPDDVFVGLRLRGNQNPELTSETVDETNLGIDVGFIDNRLNMSVDYYRRKSKGSYLNMPVVVGAPHVYIEGEFYTAPSIFDNVVDLSSGGVEVSLNYRNRSDRSIQWNSTVNLSLYDRPVIDRLGSDVGDFEFIRGFGSFIPGGLGNFLSVNRVGDRMGELYAPRLLGVDENGNAVLSTFDPNEYEPIGNGLPTTDISFFNTVSYGNWYASAMLSGSMGHSVLNIYRWFYENADRGSNTWNSVNTDKNLGLSQTPSINDNYIEDASFLRLTYLTVGRKLAFKNVPDLKVEFTVQNLFTITGYEGLDPEVRYINQRNGDFFTQGTAPGIEIRDTYFTTRTFTLAVRLSL